MIRILKSLSAPALFACAMIQFPATLHAQTPDASSPLFGDPVVASGKGFEIKRSQLDDEFINYNASMTANGRSIPEAQRGAVRSNLLEQLIITQILLQKATDNDKAQAKKQVDDYFAQVRSNYPSQEAFEQQIKSTGKTLAQVSARLQQQQMCKDIFIHEITNGIVIPDADVKKFYDEHPEDFQMPERVRAAHILLSTEDSLTHQPVTPDVKKEKLKLANELKARAEKGEDFAALAKKYSDDPGSKDKGGEYTFPRGKMVPEFEAAAFSMKTNQISDPVETKYGYHIIKLLEKFPAAKEGFDEAAPKIRNYLVGKEVEQRRPAYVAKLKADADVKIVAQSDAKPEAAKTAPAPAKP